MPPSVAFGNIVERENREIDPQVVGALVAAFRHGRAQTAETKSHRTSLPQHVDLSRRPDTPR